MLRTCDLPGGANCTRVTWSVKELEDDSDKRAVPVGPAARGLTAMVEVVRSQNRRSLQNVNMWQLARPCMGKTNACSVKGLLHGTPTETSRVDHT